MNIPYTPTQEVSGKVSWFGGPHDPSSGPTTASGASVKQPGIAVYNRATLGGYWRVTAANGKTAVLKQTDLGPAPFTGRKVDVTYSALGKLGYNEGNFPTDSQVKATYLGKNLPPSEGQVQTAKTQVTRQGAVAGLGLNAYQKTAQQAAGIRDVASLFNEPGSAALKQALDTVGKPPSAESPEKYVAVKTPEGPVVAAPHSTTAEIAERDIGKYAENQGPNLGTELNQLEAGFGMKGEPWCAIFATTVASHGGASAAIKTASVAEINQWAQEGSHGYQKGLLPSNQAKPGDLLTFGNEHVAVVKEVKGNRIYTIEGNANGSGGVVALSHKVGEGQVARPKYGGG